MRCPGLSELPPPSANCLQPVHACHAVGSSRPVTIRDGSLNNRLSSFLTSGVERLLREKRVREVQLPPQCYGKIWSRFYFGIIVPPITLRSSASYVCWKDSVGTDVSSLRREQDL